MCPPRGTETILAYLLAALLAAHSHPSQAQTVETLDFNCDLPRCQDEDEMDRLVRLIGLAEGKDYTEELGRAAVCYLEQTGFFETNGVTLEATHTTSGNVHLRIDTRPQTYIRDVHVDAGAALESEVEQRVFMRSGSRFTGDPEEVQRQAEAIRQLFVRDGYAETQVNIEETQVGPYLVDLSIEVDRGELLDVLRIYVKGNEAFSYEQIQSILLNEFGFIRTYTETELRQGLEEIIAAYREAGHIRARILDHGAVPRDDPRGVDLFVHVREGPRWTFEFTGNETFTSDELREQLRFWESGFIDQAEILNSAEELEAFYVAAGLYFADVLVRSRATVDEAGEEVTHVVYTIAEGPQAEVRSIDFEGAEHIEAEELLELLTTSEFGALESGGYLQPAQLEADIRNLEAYYHERGFLWAHVPRWTVSTDDDGESLHITLFVNEGPRTMVSEVRFRGNHIVRSSELSPRMLLRPAQPFGLVALETDRNTIISAYNARGFRPDTPQTACYAGTEEVSCTEYSLPESCFVFDVARCTERTRGSNRLQECGRMTDQAGCEIPWRTAPQQVAVEHRIVEGDLITMGEIFILGNYQTSEAVLRRELPFRERDPYNRQLLLEGQANIRGLGLFDSVSIDTIGIDPERCPTRSRAAVVVRVEEATSEYFEVRLGLTGRNTVDNQFQLVADTEGVYVDRNFVGQAAQLSAGGSFGFDLTDIERVSEEEFIASAEVEYFDPRFYYFNLTENYWELEATVLGFYDLLSTPLQKREVGGTVVVLREFEEIEGFTFSVEGRLSYVQTRRVPEEEEFDDALIIELSPALIWDRREPNPINPRRGFFGEFRLDLGDDLLGEAFSRIQLSGSHFLPLSRYFTLASHVRFGFALGGLFSLFQVPESSDQPLEERLLLPDDERFRLGGVANLRGFPDNSLGPRTQLGVPTDGDVVLNGSIELRYPLITAADLYGAAFVDAGQLHADFIDFNADDFRYSAGLGLRWLAFGLVPVILDYGLVLDRRVGENIGQAHFNVGYTF